MRQGQQQQQNRRGRGRGGRKGQSSLSRSFESSGPDVKIRGTAQHIAEKYMSLARDAIGSGDLVLGENYLQHAEHYNRIILAAQTTSSSPYDQANGNGQRVARPEGELLPGESYDGFDGDDDGDGDQPGDGQNGQMGGGQMERDQPRHHEPQGQREPSHQQRQRDNRNYEPREPRQFDNRSNENREPREPRGPREPRHFEPRQQAGQEQRGPDFRGESRGQEFREPRSFEPRHAERPEQQNRPERQERQERSDRPERVDLPRPINGNGEQPRTFEPPRPPTEAGDAQTPLVHGPLVPGPRGRRRRGRHENARPFPDQEGQIAGADQPSLLDQSPVTTPAEAPAAPQTSGAGDTGGSGEGQD